MCAALQLTADGMGNGFVPRTNVKRVVPLTKIPGFGRLDIQSEQASSCSSPPPVILIPNDLAISLVLQNTTVRFVPELLWKSPPHLVPIDSARRCPA